MNPKKAIESREAYLKSVAEDVAKMLKAGVRYSVIANVQAKSEYDTPWTVVLDPREPRDASAAKITKGCEVTHFGKFWHKEHAEVFAEAMNDQIGGTIN